MLFNSFEFAIFFAIFLVVFFTAPKRIRPVVLLLASYIFYGAWRASFLALLLLTTIVDFTTALVMQHAKTEFWRKVALATALTINFGILFSVKYLDFVLTNLFEAAHIMGLAISPFTLGLILPIGVSFYTFQSVGYSIDVYKRVLPAERNFLYYALYVAFFPQLVAGPIERASHMIAQYKAMRSTTPERIASGLWLMGWGMFQKTCIADAVSPFVSGIFANPTAYNGSYTLLASILFSIQIYCDFAGYSNIAIGVARIIGIDLMINFRQPYFSTSLTDFWRRWHISLSSWFRDYLYIPLGGNRTTRLKWVRNSLLVFGVSGFWHGANWTFIVWGLLHGIAIVIEDLLRRRSRNRPASPNVPAQQTTTYPRANSRAVRALGWIYTLCVVVVGWVFFRSKNFTDAIYVLTSWFHLGPISYGTFKTLGLPSVEILGIALNIAVLFFFEAIFVLRPDWLANARRKLVWSTPAAVCLVYDIALLGAFGSFDFIYFQF